MGGSLALWSATLSEQIVATVGFYPAVPWERMSPQWCNYAGKAALIHCSRGGRHLRPRPASSRQGGDRGRRRQGRDLRLPGHRARVLQRRPARGLRRRCAARARGPGRSSSSAHSEGVTPVPRRCHPRRAAGPGRPRRGVADCFACPRLVAWREEVAATKRAAFRDQEYWGRPVPGFGRGRRAHRDPRAGAGRARRQPHRPDLHRRPLRRRALRRAAPGRAGQPADQRRRRRRAARCTTPGSSPRCAARRRTTSRRPASGTPARRGCTARSTLIRPTLRVVVALGAFAWAAWWPAMPRCTASRPPTPRPAFGHGAHWVGRPRVPRRCSAATTSASRTPLPAGSPRRCSTTSSPRPKRAGGRDYGTADGAPADRIASTAHRQLASPNGSSPRSAAGGRSPASLALLGAGRAGGRPLRAASSSAPRRTDGRRRRPAQEPPAAAPAVSRSPTREVAPAEPRSSVPDWVPWPLVALVLVPWSCWSCWPDAGRRCCATAAPPPASGRRRPRPGSPRPPRAAEVVAALDAGLASSPTPTRDPRRAVIACWVRLEQAAAAAGHPAAAGRQPDRPGRPAAADARGRAPRAGRVRRVYRRGALRHPHRRRPDARQARAALQPAARRADRRRDERRPALSAPTTARASDEPARAAEPQDADRAERPPRASCTGSAGCAPRWSPCSLTAVAVVVARLRAWSSASRSPIVAIVAGLRWSLRGSAAAWCSRRGLARPRAPARGPALRASRTSMRRLARDRDALRAAVAPVGAAARAGAGTDVGPLRRRRPAARCAELTDERLRQRHGITRASDPRRARQLLGEPLWSCSVPTPGDAAAAEPPRSATGVRRSDWRRL